VSCNFVTINHVWAQTSAPSHPVLKESRVAGSCSSSRTSEISGATGSEDLTASHKWQFMDDVNRKHVLQPHAEDATALPVPILVEDCRQSCVRSMSQLHIDPFAWAHFTFNFAPSCNEVLSCLRHDYVEPWNSDNVLNLQECTALGMGERWLDML
jgi:hypothetical protein